MGPIAVFALLFGLGVPQGFMVAATALGPELVICTGHGPLTAHAGDAGAPAHAPKGRPAPICPFAGHGGTPSAPASLAFGFVQFDAFTAPEPELGAVSPGRGLAAPPPPSQAPPADLV